MDRIGKLFQQARSRAGVLIILGYLSALALDPFTTIIRLNVENWAADKKLDRLLVDGAPQGAGPMSLLADLLAGILSVIAVPISLAASPIGLAFALGALRWSRLFGQNLRWDKWIVCRGWAAKRIGGMLWCPK